jgi:AcrR family transcriptional regulator
MSQECSVAEPVDPRTRRTRKLLQEAFRALIQEKRFSAISVQEITARATVNRATFYAHFVSKEELAASVLKTELHTALFQRFASKPPLTSESLTEMAVVIFEFLGNSHGACPENAAELQDTVGTTVQQGLYEMMEMWLSGNVSWKRLFPGCTKETVASVLSWSIYGGAQQWISAKRRTPVRQVCQEIVSILLPSSSIK